MVMRSNYEGPASILAVLANSFEERGSGCLVGISSVAGERGRQQTIYMVQPGRLHRLSFRIT